MSSGAITHIDFEGMDAVVSKPLPFQSCDEIWVNRTTAQRTVMSIALALFAIISITYLICYTVDIDPFEMQEGIKWLHDNQATAISVSAGLVIIFLFWCKRSDKASSFALEGAAFAAPCEVSFWRPISIASSGIPKSLHDGIESVSVHGDIASWKEARRVFVADTCHPDGIQRGFIRGFLSTCPARGDVVLLEGFGKGEVPDARSEVTIDNTDPAKGVLVFGWENMALYESGCAYIKLMEQFLHLSDLIRRGGEQLKSTDELIVLIQSQLETGGIYEIARKMQEEQLGTLRALRESTLTTLDSTSLMYTIVVEKLRAGKEQHARDVLVGRNRSLVESVEHFRDRRTFVHAGAAHFREDPLLLRAFERDKVMRITFKKHVP